MLKGTEKIQIHITIVLGTARTGRLSEKVAREAERYILAQKECSVTFVDVRDYAFTKTEPGWEENKTAEPWRNIVQKSDGFVFVIPEYNRSFPGELKLLLDSESPKNYSKKALALVGVSSGDYGGSRAVTSILPVVSELGLVYNNRPLLVSNVGKLFDPNGRIVQEKRETFENQLLLVLNELEWYARLLKDGRDAKAERNNVI